MSNLISKSERPILKRMICLSAAIVAGLLPIISPILIIPIFNDLQNSADAGYLDPQQIFTVIYFLITLIIFTLGYNLVLKSFQQLSLNALTKKTKPELIQPFSYRSILIAILGAILFIAALSSLRASSGEIIFWLLIAFITLKPLELQFIMRGRHLIPLFLGSLANSMLTMAMFIILGINWVVPGIVFGIGVAGISKSIELALKYSKNVSLSLNARLALAIAALQYSIMLGFLVVANFLPYAYLSVVLVLPVILKAISGLNFAARGEYAFNISRFKLKVCLAGLFQVCATLAATIYLN
jgi:hypothetical protein